MCDIPVIKTKDSLHGKKEGAILSSVCYEFILVDG